MTGGTRGTLTDATTNRTMKKAEGVVLYICKKEGQDLDGSRSLSRAINHVFPLLFKWTLIIDSKPERCSSKLSQVYVALQPSPYSMLVLKPTYMQEYGSGLAWAKPAELKDLKALESRVHEAAGAIAAG
jgi:hypothetical protein